MDVRLQLLVKKDPASYTALYANEVEKLRGMLRISKLDPEAKNPELCSLLVFLPHVSTHYEEDIASDIFNYMLDYYTLLDKSLAQAAITSITLLKKSKQIGPEVFYKQSIPLIEEMDKRTKTIFVQFIISEIIRDKEHWPLIKETLLTAIRSGVEAHAKRAAYVFMHMVSREAWVDGASTETVFEILLSAPDVVVNFIFMYLLDRVELMVKEEDIELPDTEKKGSKIKRETKGDEKKKEKQKKEIEKKLAKREEKRLSKDPNIIMLLKRLEGTGPAYGAKIFKQMKNSNKSADLKLKMAQVVSRIACFYKINIKGFLGYMTRFMFPHQVQLPLVFSSIVQSIHETTPPKEIEAICEMIIENFCNDYKDDEVIAYGINSLKAIIRRYPEASAYKCIQYVLDYRKTKKKRALTASTALKKMIRESEKAAYKLKQAEKKAAQEEARALAEENASSNASDGVLEEAEDEDEDENDEFETDSDQDLGSEYDENLDPNQDSDSDMDSDSGSLIESSEEDPNGFVPEEKISKIRKKATKEEIIEKAKSEKYKKFRKDLPTSNKTKQKETNYTVRKTKHKSVAKKLSSKGKKSKQGKRR
ncbi:protein SDA1 [Nematocida displodere]|uniref:Protein SDA1 n=1 Tax=Nematocida displodere TaxID=1805483 RepID=A0A177EJ85_9MICR|nr:protein SDA1 [Nematocida displodere]